MGKLKKGQKIYHSNDVYLDGKIESFNLPKKKRGLIREVLLSPPPLSYMLEARRVKTLSEKSREI